MSTILDMFATYSDCETKITEYEAYIADLRKTRWNAAEGIFNAVNEAGELQGSNPFTVDGIQYQAGKSPGKGNHFRVVPVLDPAARKEEKAREAKELAALHSELAALKAEKLALLKERGFDI